MKLDDAGETPDRDDRGDASLEAETTATARASRSSRPVAVARAAVDHLPHAALLAAVLALSFLSGGYVLARAAFVVFALGAVSVTWVWAGTAVRPRVAYLVGLAGLVMYAFWAGLSVLWSIGPDLTWIATDYALLYVVVACLAGFARVGRSQLRLTGYGYLVVAVPVAVYALLGKVLPDVVEHAHVYARLSEPLGYWNVLAMVLALAIPIGVEAAARRGVPVVLRGLAAGATTLFALTFVFTFSRGGFLALGLALIVYFALTNERLTSFASLLVAGVPALAAVYQARGLETLFDSTTDDALRSVQGHAFGRSVLVAVAVAFVVQVAVAVVHRRLRLGVTTRRVAGAVVAVVALVGMATGSWAYMEHLGGPRAFADSITSQFRADADTASPGSSGVTRMLSVSSNGRVPIWRTGVRQYRTHRSAGTGAGTFRFSNYLYRESENFVVKHAHNQWVNALSELGLCGAILFTIAAGGLTVGALWPLRRGGRDRDRGLHAALQAGVVAFFFHLVVDWDWDMAAVTLAVLLFAGVAAGWRGGDPPAPPPRRPRRGVAPRVLATGVLALVVLSWTLPFLSERAASDAVTLASEGRLDQAAAAARRAHRLDPLAVEPLITLALIEQQQGSPTEASVTLDKALALQPQNYRVHYQMGLLRLNLGQRDEAVAAFRRALELNPYDDATRLQMELIEGP